MLERLKDYYKGSIVINKLPENQRDYWWFLDESNTIIGLEKNALSEKDFDILSLFLTPVASETLHLSSEQRIWRKLLFKKNNEEQIQSLFQQIKTKIISVRFIQFYITEPFFEKLAFEEALHGLLPLEFTIVWKDNQYGTIIELYKEPHPELSLDHYIFDTLTTDFYITISAFAGKLHPFDSTLVSVFQWEHELFRTVRQYGKTKGLLQTEDALSRFLLHKLKQDTKQQFVQQVLQHVNNDKELLTTVRAYLECNMNVSLTAKNLYMHRNSVQYRVDKFIEKTGIDIRNFKGAVSVYLALLSHEQASV